MDKSKIEEVLLPVSIDKQEKRERKVRDQFWPKFKSFASQLPLAEDVVAGYYCATDRQTPLKVRGTLFAALAYFIVPLDMVPDILALVGLSDDIAVLTAALTIVGSHITDEHREKAQQTIADMHEDAVVS